MNRRIFLAVNFNAEVMRALQEAQEIIQPLLSKGRLANPSLFHLTLQFLGDLSENEIKALLLNQHQWTTDLKPFTMQTGRLGLFEKGNKSVLWTGINKNRMLDQLAAQVRETLGLLGYQDPRPFRAHVTLAREAVFLNREARQAYHSLHLHIPAIQVNEFHVMESLRMDHKLVYRSLKAIPIR